MFIEIALHKLLEEPACKKAFLDLQMELIHLSKEEMASINANKEFSAIQKQTIIQYKKQQLRDAIDVDKQLQQLINNLSIANSDPQLNKSAWRNIIAVLLKAYYVSRDDVTNFKNLSNVIELLALITDAYIEEFSGKLQADKQFAAHIIKLIFIVANFYGMNDQVVKCGIWHDKAENFILANGLDKTQELAIYYNFRAGELARRFLSYQEDGSLNTKPFPTQSIEYLHLALDLHLEIGNTLATNAHMRHVLMCLTVIRAQVLMHRVQMSTTLTTKFMADLEQESNSILNLLSILKPYIQNDGYRMSTVLQVEAKLHLLKGEFTDAIDKAVLSLDFMPEQQTGQMSSVLNDAANMYIAMGAILCESASLDDVLQEISGHPYVKIARKIFAAIPLEVEPIMSKEQTLAIADNYIMLGIACYVKSHQISYEPDQPERIYADQAKYGLQQVGIEESLIEVLYFDDRIEDVINEHKLDILVIPKANNSTDLITMFRTKVQQGLNDLHDMIANSPYNPFRSITGSTPRP